VALAPLLGTIVRGQPITPVQSPDLAQRFSLGQTLKGTVLRALPEGQTLVNFGGQHVLLDLGHALARGQTFLATVTQITPSLMLKMLDEGHEVPPSAATPVTPHHTPSGARTAATPLTLDAAQLKPYVVAKQPFGDMLSTLQQHLAPHPILHEVDALLQQRLTTTLTALMPDTAQAPDTAMLQEQVDRSGLNYEAKVADFFGKQAVATDREALTRDLKGQLLEILSRLEQHATSHGDAPDLRRHARASGAHHRHHQHDNGGGGRVYHRTHASPERPAAGTRLSHRCPLSRPGRSAIGSGRHLQPFTHGRPVSPAGCHHMKRPPSPRPRRAAVALKYTAATDQAPKITATGQGCVAEKIIALARARGVPIRQDADLVQVLSQLDLRQEIPPSLYQVLAELLAFVYRLNNDYPPLSS
jgi:flagellar biosynthesis protein